MKLQGQSAVDKESTKSQVDKHYLSSESLKYLTLTFKVVIC